MEPNQTTSRKVSAKDFFLNLGAIVALYTLVVSLVNLLFTVINVAYPQINQGYNYIGSQSISWPVATLVIIFPIFILLMWLLEKEYNISPEMKVTGIHKWLSYITLFLSGLLIAGDLIAVLYYFLDGQELTTGFLLKILVLLIISTCIFMYYISDIRGRLTSKSRMMWRIIAGVIMVASILWGFSVLGSPATQRLYKHDDQKINDLMTLSSQINNYYSMKGVLPQTLADVATVDYYVSQTDNQTKKPYEYQKTSATVYNLCAEFNKASIENGKQIPVPAYPYGGPLSWSHPAGRYCFSQTINPDIYAKTVMVR